VEIDQSELPHTATFQDIEVAVFPSTSLSCGANGEHLHCVDLGDAVFDMEGCVQHCHQQLGDEFASAIVSYNDNVVAGTCCCNDFQGCRCATTEWGGFKSSFELAMVNVAGASWMTEAQDNRLEQTVGHLPLEKTRFSSKNHSCPDSLVDGGFLQKCRPLHSRNTICANYLNETTMYYSLDTPPSDLENLFEPAFEILESVMVPDCVANVMNLMCNSWFKPCQEIEGDWVPSLLCRSDCERHLQVWNECVANIGAVASLKNTFAHKMDQLTDEMGYQLDSSGKFAFDFPSNDGRKRPPFTLSQCDVTGGTLDDIPDENRISAFLLGRHPYKEHAFGKKYSPYFPEGMSLEAMYPEVASSYEDPDRGRLYSNVPCHHLEDYRVDETECPDGFLPPVDPRNPRRCISPCPVPAFSEAQYTTMWMASSVAGLFGLLLNIFMVSTWFLAGWKYLKGVHLQLKMCVFGGILYGEPPPSLSLSLSPPPPLPPPNTQKVCG
jgi:hypothetical protein